MKWYERIYALYKGDVNICDGTIPEIAEYTGKTTTALRYMLTPAYERRGGKDMPGGRRRYELVLIEDDEQELKRNA